MKLVLIMLFGVVSAVGLGGAVLTVLLDDEPQASVLAAAAVAGGAHLLFLVMIVVVVQLGARRLQALGRRAWWRAGAGVAGIAIVTGIAAAVARLPGAAVAVVIASLLVQAAIVLLLLRRETRPPRDPAAAAARERSWLEGTAVPQRRLLRRALIPGVLVVATAGLIVLLAGVAAGFPEEPAVWLEIATPVLALGLMGASIGVLTLSLQVPQHNIRLIALPRARRKPVRRAVLRGRRDEVAPPEMPAATAFARVMGQLLPAMLLGYPLLFLGITANNLLAGASSDGVGVLQIASLVVLVATSVVVLSIVARQRAGIRRFLAAAPISERDAAS